MKELVEVITKALVDDPESVVVTEKVEGKTIIVEEAEQRKVRQQGSGKCHRHGTQKAG